jgi:plastocyanin domain-containing protein
MIAFNKNLFIPCMGEVKMKCKKILSALFIFFLICSAQSLNAQKKQFVATVDKDGVQRIEMLAGEYFFNPNYIIVKVNVPVEIKIKKEPTIVPHSFVTKAPEAGMDIYESLRSEPKIIRLTPTKVGKYPFYCDKKFLFSKSHREKGMEGIIEVTE